MTRGLHWLSLLLETLGTLFVWLETKRYNARLKPEGTVLSDPPRFRAWYYHWGFVGFSLLLAGILLSGFALFLET